MTVKPCPFCNKEIKIVKDNDMFVFEHDIFDCPMYQNKQSRLGYTTKYAITKRWNTRPIEDDLQSKLDEIKRLLAAKPDTLEAYETIIGEIWDVVNGGEV